MVVYTLSVLSAVEAMCETPDAMSARFTIVASAFDTATIISVSRDVMSFKRTSPPTTARLQTTVSETGWIGRR